MTKLSLMCVAILGSLAIGCVEDGSFAQLDQDIATRPDARTITELDAAQRGSDMPAPPVDAAPAPPDAPVPVPAPPKADKPTRKTTDNVESGIRNPFRQVPSKAAQIKKVGALTATALDKNPPVSQRTMAIGGTCVTVSDIPAGYLVGSSGADPCVIAVIVKKDGTVIACHFTATDDPGATLAKLAPFGDGAHAAIAGGVEVGPSQVTLADVIAGLNAHKIKIDGELDRIGVYWDSDNQRWVYTPLDTASDNDPKRFR